jgi:hypothetical protein
MFCPQCRMEYREGFVECSDCQIPLVDRLPEPGTPADSLMDVPEEVDGGDLDVREGEDNLDTLIQTGFGSPVAIGLAKSLLQEAGIPFFSMDQNPAARQESGNFLAWWNVRVPSQREGEARKILRSVEEMR